MIKISQRTSEYDCPFQQLSNYENPIRVKTIYLCDKYI